MKTDKNALIFWAGLALIILFFLNRILQAFGLKESKADKLKEIEIDKLASADYFNPSYFQGRAFRPLGDNMAQSIARQVRKAVKGWGTNEAELYAAFNQMFNKTNISEVAHKYGLEYNSVMVADIMNDLNKDEQFKLKTFIDKLPNA